MLVAERLRRRNIEPATLFDEAGVPWVRSDGADQAPSDRQAVFLDLAAAALDDDLLGFHLAQDFDLRLLGFTHYVIASARRLGEALASGRLLSPVTNEVVCLRAEQNGGLSLKLAAKTGGQLLNSHQAEFWLTGALRLCRDLTGRALAPVTATLVHTRTGPVREINHYFERRVVFGAEQNLLVFAPEAADLPLATHDPYLHALLIALGEQVPGTAGDELVPLRDRVEKAIIPRLRFGTATIDAVARDLGTSARTLSRKLVDAGTSFSRILDEVRFSLAVRYLREGAPTMSQIAWLLGYREPSATVRAFRRWTGVTPTEFRRTLKSD